MKARINIRQYSWDDKIPSQGSDQEKWTSGSEITCLFDFLVGIFLELWVTSFEHSDWTIVQSRILGEKDLP
jgi:hypothetical protein